MRRNSPPTARSIPAIRASTRWTAASAARTAASPMATGSGPTHQRRNRPRGPPRKPHPAFQGSRHAQRRRSPHQRGTTPSHTAARITLSRSIHRDKNTTNASNYADFAEATACVTAICSSSPGFAEKAECFVFSFPSCASEHARSRGVFPASFAVALLDNPPANPLIQRSSLRISFSDAA